MTAETCNECTNVATHRMRWVGPLDVRPVLLCDACAAKASVGAAGFGATAVVIEPIDSKVPA